MNYRYTAFVLALIALTLSLFFPSGCAKKEETIKIGVAGPMTGDQSKMGVDMKNGAKMAIKEWNQKGGALGKKSASC